MGRTGNSMYYTEDMELVDDEDYEHIYYCIIHHICT